jgi:chromosome segregation ATPase
MAVKSTKTKLPTHAELTARVNTLRRAHEDLLVRFNTVQHELDDNERDTNAKCSALEGTVTAKLDRAVADTQGRVAQVEGENRHLADLGENLMSRINQVEEQIREVVTLAEQLVKATGEQKDYCQRRTQVEFGKFHGLADKVDEHLTDHAEVIRQSVQNQLELIVDETVKVLEREGWRRPAEGRKSVLEPGAAPSRSSTALTAGRWTGSTRRARCPTDPRRPCSCGRSVGTTTG